MADLFKTAGADRLMAVDLHTAQIQGFFDGPVDHLFALPMLAEYFEAQARPTAASRSSRRTPAGCGSAERWTDRLGAPLAIIHKRRDPDVANQVKVHEVVGEVAGPHLHPGRRHDRHRRHDREGRRGAVRAGRGRGDRRPRPTACCPGRAVDRLKNSRISEVIVTNTLPIPPEKRFDKLTVLSIAPLIARAITRGVRATARSPACSTARAELCRTRLGPARDPAKCVTELRSARLCGPRHYPGDPLPFRPRRTSRGVRRARSTHLRDPRTEFGKGAARRDRRAGLVPAVLYGHGTEPRHLSLPGHDVLLALQHRERPDQAGRADRRRASWRCPRPCSGIRSRARSSTST